VLVSGRHRGRTPLQLELPAGRRTLILKPFGQATPLRRTVLVKRNRAIRLVVPVQAR
jgi:hypothetical protein